MHTIQIFFQLPTPLARLFLLCNWKARRTRELIDRYLNRMIEQELLTTPEMRAERKKVSLIASLVTALQEDEELEAAKPEEEKKGLTTRCRRIFSKTLRLGLSRLEVMHEMLAFLAAGYGTTSTALAWFIHVISKNPPVQSKIKEELSQYNGQRLALEQLDSLSYLDCVLRELFRFVPPILGTFRTLTVDDQLPDSGFQLHKGDSVFISFYSLARDERYWSDRYDLNAFHPERFLDDLEPKNNLAASMAFGGGHRQCMGQDLARFELKIICARLMQSVTFGDGGPELNAGGHESTDTIKPRKVGVTIAFDE